MILVLVAAFLVLLFAGIPIAYILGLVALLGISQLNSISLITVVQKMFTGLNSFTLLAVPLFVLAANIMNRAKISEKLIQFCNGIVGRFPGGLAYANVLVSMLFAGISGSSQADTAGIGSILIPAMEEEGLQSGNFRRCNCGFFYHRYRYPAIYSYGRLLFRSRRIHRRSVFRRCCSGYPRSVLDRCLLFSWEIRNIIIQNRIQCHLKTF